MICKINFDFSSVGPFVRQTWANESFELGRAAARDGPVSGEPSGPSPGTIPKALEKSGRGFVQLVNPNKNEVTLTGRPRVQW
jgi:hypothetical protein